MSYRSLNPTLQASLHGENTKVHSFGYAHLIKFEKPIPGTELTYSERTTPANKAINYTYLTDGAYDIKFDDGTSDASGNPNGEQNYLANKVLNVGTTSETIQAKSTTMSLKLAADSIGISVTGVYGFTSTEITMSAGTTWVDQGFQEGDSVIFSGGVNNGQVVRIDSFTTSNTKIKYTPLPKDDGTLSSITASSTVTCTAKYHSAEINALTTLKSDPSFSSYLNREVFVYRAHINSDTGAVTGAPFLLFKGIITGGKLQEDPLKGSSITWSLTSHWGDFVQVKGRTTSDAGHRGLNTGGVTDEEAVFRPEYANDLAFRFSDQAVNVAATYQVFEDKVRVEQSGGFFKGDIAGIDNTYIDKVPVDRDVDLAFNLKSRYLPVVYGVQKLPGIPFFADGLKDNAKIVYIASALCEGPIHSIMDLHVDDEPLICMNSADAAERTGESSEARVVCYGRSDKGDLLLGDSDRLDPSVLSQEQDILNELESYEPTSDSGSLANIISQLFYADRITELQVELGAVRDEINNFVGQASLTHEKKFNFNSPMKTQFTFHAGRSDQGSDANYTTIGGQGNFKLQSMYHTESANSNYWGPNHRALDTAYVAQVFTINAEEFTVPKTSYIVKGKVLDCFNYDRSYYGNKNPTDSSTTHADFQLGDYVKLFNHTSAQLNSGTNTNETVQIIDKFLFYTDDGEPEYRYRFSKNLHLKEDNSNLSLDVSHFYMQHLTNSNKRWYFAAHDAHIVKADGSGLIRDLPLPTQQIFTNTSNSSIAFADATQGITLKNGIGQNVAVKTMTGFPTNNAELAMGKYLTFSMNNGSQGGFMTPTSTFTIPYVTYNAATGTLSFPLESQALARGIENKLLQANLGIADSNITGAFWKIAVSDVVKLSGSISSDDDVYNRSRLIIKRVLSSGHISKYDKVIEDYDASESLVRVNRNSPFRFNQFPGTDSTSTYLFDIAGSIDVDTAAFNSLHGKGKDRRVSINPAIQLLDYLTNDRYGKGLNIDNDIDKESFLSAARFCDSRSDVTMIVKTSDLTTTPTEGSIYKYPASGSPILFQGTVKGTPITYDSVGEGDNSATGFTQIVFTDVIGQLGRKWNDYRLYDAGKHIIYHQGSAFMAGSTGTMNATTRDSRIANNTISSVTLTRVGTTGTGDSTIAINVEKKFGIAGNGNPVVRQFSAAGSNFKAMGYSLYDGDDCKYWKLLGWDDAEQRNVTRHQTNQIIDTAEPVFSNVNAMLSQFNGMLRYGNGKYSLAVKQKAPTDAHFNTFSAKVINEEDIIGSISIDDGTSKKKLNQVNANIVDPSLRFGGRGITFTNSDYIKQDRGIKKEGNISVKGITNYFNARIAVKQLLDESRFGLTAKFTLDSSGYLLQAGDIIRINYSRFGWVNKNYRIQSLNFSPNGEVQIIAREHNEDAYTVEYVEDFINSNNSDGGSQGGRSFTAPGAPTGGSTTTDQAGRVKLAWTNGTEFVPTVQATQVARNTANVTPNAAGDNVTILADTQQDNYIDSAPGDFSAGDVSHYYWVRHAYSRNHGHTASVERNKFTAWLALGQGTAKVTTKVEVEGGVEIETGGVTFPNSPSGTPSIKAGQTDFDTGTGFFLGRHSSAYKLSIGNSSANKLTFDGTNLAVTGNITASSLTISNGASVSGSIPNTNVSGLGTASTQNSDDFATGAEGDLATSASQVNVGLALLTNKKLSAADATVVAAETGEALICAVDKNGNPDHLNDGFIQWEGSKITVERIQYTSGTTSGLSLLTGSENNKGFIVFDTAKGNPFTISGTDMDIAFAWKIGTQWYYDSNVNDNTGTTFTPASTYVALGYLETASTHDNILRGGLFGQPIPLEQAAFPGDEQISGTIGGGWNIDNEAIFTGTKDSSGYNGSNNITLHKDGGIHAKKFYIDASDGSAHFKGAIEGGSIGGENTNAIPSTIFSRTVANSKGAPTGNETGGFIDLTTGDFVFGDASTFISFSPTSDDSNSPARKLTLKGDLEAENLTVTSSISTPLLKVGRLESGTVRVSDIREEVFSEIDSRLGNTGGYYASYETQVGNSDAGFKGEDATTTFTKELTNGGSGFAHAGETTFLNFALNDQFAAPVPISTNTGAGRHPNDLKITAKFQKKIAGQADSTYVNVGSVRTFQLDETLIPYATRYTAEFNMNELITTDSSGDATDPANHISGTSYVYRVVLAAIAQPGGSTYKSYFKTYYDSSGTLEGIGANDQAASPVFFEIREGSVGSSAGNLDTTQFITRTGDNNTNIEFLDDKIKLNAGGETMATFTEAASDTITLHKDTTVSTNLTVSGNATVTGNLTVDGTTTTLNTTNLNVQDKNILLANGSANKAASDGAGITVDLGTNDPVTPDASLTYAQATNDWLMNKNLRIVTGASTGTFQVGRDDTNQYLQLHVTDGNNTITAKQDADENSAHSFILDRVFAGSGASDFHIRKDGTDQLIIDTSGQVGIGTSDPARALHVSSGTTNEVARFESTDTACLVEFKDTTGTASIETRNDFRFTAGGDERMRIDSSGNVSIGTTSTTYNLNLTVNDSTPQTGTRGMYLDMNLSDEDPEVALSSDITHAGVFVDIDSTVSAGDVSEEHRVYGVYADVDINSDGDSDLVYGVYGHSESNSTAGTCSGLRGVVGSAVNDNSGTSRTANTTAGLFTATHSSKSTTASTQNYIGTQSTVRFSTNATVDANSMYGAWNEVEIDAAAGTAGKVDGSLFATYSIFDNDDQDNDTIEVGNTYLFYGNYVGGVFGNQRNGTTSYGLYIPTDVPNYFGGKVGIGTNAPSHKLQVVDSVNGILDVSINNQFDDDDETAPNPSSRLFINAVSNNGYLHVHGAPENSANLHKVDLGSTAAGSFLTFSPSETEAMRITSTGNVGIGTSDPKQKLQVEGNIYLGPNDNNGKIIHGGNATTLSSDGPLYFVMDSNDTTGPIDNSSDAAIIFGGGSQIDTNSTLNFTAAQYSGAGQIDYKPRNELMRITPAGNVGIGTNSPAAKLQVEDLGIETTSTSVSSTSATVVDTFAKATFRSARYTVQITQGSAYQCSDIMAIHDGTTAIGTEYAMIETGSILGTLDVAINGDNVELKVTMAAATAATVKVVRHCVAV